MTRFKQLRIQRGLTQNEFLKLFNETYGRTYTPAAISQIEHGKRNPELSALVDFADFYDVSLDYLLGRDSTTPAYSPSPANELHEGSNLPRLSRSDERKIANDLENMLNSLNGAAAMGDSEDEEDRQLLKSALEQAMRLSKRIAKKKFSPKNDTTKEG